MGTRLPALYGAPATIQAPYGCLIEHTALLIELTALSVGPFPLTLRRGTAGHPFGTPAPTHRGQSRVRRERGSRGARKLVAGERKGQERQLLEVFTKCVHFCWQSEAGNVNWGQREVSVFTGPASSSAAGGEAAQQLSATATFFFSLKILWPKYEG